LLSTVAVETQINPIITYGNGIGIVSNTYDEPWQVTTDGFQSFQAFDLEAELAFFVTAVQFVNNQFILEGGNGLLATSTDASSWDVVPSGLPCSQPTGLLTYGDEFIIGMDGFNQTGPIYTSSDGINWKILTNVPSLSDLYYSDYLEAYVASTYYSLKYTDNLAGNWNEVSPPADGSGIGTAVAGNGVWAFTVNQRHDFVYIIGSIVVSSDLQGSSWTTVWQYQTTLSDVVTNPVFANSMFYVGDIYSSQLLRSPNATSWDIVTLPFECQLYDLQAANDIVFVGCNEATSEYYVLKNNQWSGITDAFDTALLYLNLLPNGLYVGIDSTYVIWTSEDAVNWQQMVGPNSQVFSTDVEYIAYANGMYGLLGGNCDFWTGDS